MANRIETDFLGELSIPENALYGIHSKRAAELFVGSQRFNKNWYCAVGTVKQACYQTVEAMKQAMNKKVGTHALKLKLPETEVLEALKKAAYELATGWHFENFIVPSLQGGAGTAINLNINEILANRALQHMNQKTGNYGKVHPLEDANVFQSTNDVIPTALTVAIIKLLNDLEASINKLRNKTESLEHTYRHSVRLAHTQMQQAVPSSYGKLFGAYSEMLSRDWWRVSKCFERIKTVNLGGSAVGTAIGVPRYFVLKVVNQLQQLTDLPITGAENLPDATMNLDRFVEVHATLKAHAVNLEKMVSDIRLLASGVVAGNEVAIPKKLTGSSIMPGKVNPIIPELVISTAHKVYANDQLIAGLAAQGMLDLNAYLPEIGDAILNSLEWLIQADNAIEQHLLTGLTVDTNKAEARLFNSPAVTAALNPLIGYQKASELANFMLQNNCSIFEANTALEIFDSVKLKDWLDTSSLLKNGFTIGDLISLT